MEGNCPGGSCLQLFRGELVRGNCPRVKSPGDNCPGGNFMRGNCPEAFVQGGNVQIPFSDEINIKPCNYSKRKFLKIE